MSTRTSSATSSPSLTSTLLRLPIFLLLTLLIAQPAVAANPFVQYANDFVDPSSVIASSASSLQGAQDTVVAWAEEMNSHGPWSVTFKPVVAPSGNKHDYMSWAPYRWPDCSSVKNKTELTPAQIRTTCPYVNRDGEVNPDRNIPNDFQSFFNLSDAVLYNALASTFQSSSAAAQSQANAVKYIKTWFIDSDTKMNQNLNYAQMHLGPDGQLGTFTGILDLRMMVKVASGVLILRKTNASAWTKDLDNALVSWCKQYINWLQTAPTAQQAATAKNNHGTYFAGQLMALQILVGDTAGATKTGRGYFGGAFNGQIAANGDQPLEATRTRPYHYRNFNIAGMITAARLLKYVDPSSNVWNTSSISDGATIQKAVDFVMTVDPSKDVYDSEDTDVTEEIYPNIAAVASTYGDPDGRYVAFLKSSGFPYADDAFFVWDQPLAGGKSSGSASGSGSASTPVPSATAPKGSSLATAPLGSSSAVSTAKSATGKGANGVAAGGSTGTGIAGQPGIQQASAAADSLPSGSVGGSLGSLTGESAALRPVAALWTAIAFVVVGLLRT